MKTRSLINPKTPLLLCALVLSTGLALQAQPAKKEDASKPAAQKGFETAQQAADALVTAAEGFDTAALKEILGPGSDDLVVSEDQVQDKNRAAAFATHAKAKMSVEVETRNPNRAAVVVGTDEWPLPIPLVKRQGKWYFDAKAGREAILLRRIGGNEFDTLEICRGYAEAQHEYARQEHDGAKANQFAQKIISTPGKQDGLAWKNADGTVGGPVGETVARALEMGYGDKREPFHGYYFKVLKGQGPAAPKGQMDFVVDGAMTGGFALAAAPAEYRVTGVQTFIVGPDGVVYQKDLGAGTLKAFEAMDRYNPDKTWTRTDDSWPKEAGVASP